MELDPPRHFQPRILALTKCVCTLYSVVASASLELIRFVFSFIYILVLREFRIFYSIQWLFRQLHIMDENAKELFRETFYSVAPTLMWVISYRNHLNPLNLFVEQSHQSLLHFSQCVSFTWLIFSKLFYSFWKIILIVSLLHRVLLGPEMYINTTVNCFSTLLLKNEEKKLLICNIYTQMAVVSGDVF